MMASFRDVISRTTGRLAVLIVFVGILFPNPLFCQSEKVDPNIFRVFLPGNETNFEYLWLTTDDPSFKFRVKACDDAHIALARLPERTTDDTYEIVIGKDNVSIALAIGAEPVKVSPLADKPFLQCGKFTNMWVSWQGGVISVGTGSIGKNVIVSYDDSESGYYVTGVGMSSGPLSTGGTRWEFWRDEARATFIKTSQANNKRDIWVTEYERKHLTFAVKSINTAKVFINDKMGNLGDSYVVSIGDRGNQRSSVKVNGANLVVEDTPGILDSNDFRFFWISWASDVIQVGRGLRVGDKVFMTTPLVPTTNLTALTILSTAAEAFWEFRNVEENYFLLRSESGTNNSKAHAINVEQRHTFLFRVRACSKAVVELKRKFGQHTSGTPRFVRMTIGWERDVTRIDYIWEDGHNDITDTFPTPYVLDCNAFRTFWYSWKGEIFRLGTGHIPFKNQLFKIADRYKPLSVQSLHLSSLNNKDKVEWQFDRDQGKSVTIHTEPAFSHSQAWFTVAERHDIVFKLRTCHSARILLATYMANPEVHTYEIFLGNTSSIIKDFKVGNVNDSAQTGDLLSCSGSRYLWVSWKGGSFEVGRGNVAGAGGFLKAVDMEPYQINAVSFAGDLPAEWMFTEAQGEQYIVYTNKLAGGDYENFKLATHRHVFPFQLKTPQSVNIVLLRTPRGVSNGDVELMLGLFDNTKSSIGIVGDSTPAVINSTYDILSESELRPYWVAWVNGKVQFGVGYPFNKALLELQLPQPYRIRGLAFDHQESGHAEWVFSPEVALVLMKRTPAKDQYYPYRYDQLWATTGGRTSYVFRVSAGAEANVVLAPYIEDTENGVYEITIGADANNLTLLREGTHIKPSQPGRVLQVQITRNILSADELRTFWISWLNGFIQFGRGYEVGVDEILGFVDLQPKEIHAVSIATESTPGQWEISNVPNNIYHMETAPTSGTDKFAGIVLTTRKTFLQFRSVTCTSARIALFSELEGGATPNLHLYEVVIGENGTQSVSLYRPVGVYEQKLLMTVPYPEVFSCGQARLFWISWSGGLLRVGEGKIPSRIILTWEDKTFVVNAFSFGSGEDGLPTPGQWEVDNEAVDRAMFTTPGVKNYDQFWLTTTTKEFIMFRLQIHGHASLALSEIAGVTEYLTYEIVIGGGGSHSSAAILKDGVEKVNKTIPDLVNEDVGYEFWIGWRNGFVSLGKGTVFGELELIQWEDTTPHKVHYVAVTSDYYPGTWGFYNLQGNMYDVQTKQSDDVPESYSTMWFAPLPHEKLFTFSVAACKNVRLALAADALDYNKATYEILIGGRETDSNVEFSAIRNSVGGKNKTSARTPGILDCAALKDFWVSWTDPYIRLGSGQPYSTEKLRHRMPLFGPNPQIVSLASGPNSDAKWAFNTEQVNGIHVVVSERKSYRHLWVSVQGKDRLVFSVKACRHAALALSAIPFQTFRESYEIEIYTSENATNIRDTVGGDVIISTSTAVPVLDCDTYRPLWVQWTATELEVGSGAYVGRQGLAKIEPEGGVHVISSVGVSMGGGNTGSWNIPRTEGNVYRLITPAMTSYGRAWLFFKKKHLTFSVRACQNARIVLVGTKGNLFKDTLELTIGAWENTKVELRYFLQTEPVETVERVGLLDCSRLRRFWISWKDSDIEFGTGRLGGHTLLSWPFREPGTDIPIPFDIAAASFATNELEGEWEIDQQYDSCLGGTERVHEAAEGMSSSCPSIITMPTHGQLLCREQMCEYNGNVAEYKIDNPGSDTGVCNIRLCPSLDDLQLSDVYGGQDIYRLTSAVEPYVATTDIGLSYDQHWISVTGSDAIVFYVQACSDVHLALAAIPGISTTLAYEVVIGGSGNRRSSIRADTGVLTNPVVTKDTPDIVDCNQVRPFWVSWLYGEIQVGRGVKVSMDPFMTWSPQDDLHIINSVGISTASGSMGVWNFGPPSPELPDEEPKVDYYVVKTKGSKAYGNTLWTISRNYLLFSVRACSDAHVIVSEVPRLFDFNAFKVVIGSNGNNKTSITGEGGRGSQTANTPSILDCNSYRTFWVQWNSQLITFGKGREIGKDQLVSLFSLDMPALSGVSIGTDGVTGLWQISKTMGHEYQFTTEGAENGYDEVWAEVDEVDNMVFEVKACYDVKLLLNSKMDPAGDSYEVILGTSGNTASIIRDKKDGKAYVIQDTPNILDCYEYRAFWVRWVQGVEVGYGMTVGNRPFMSVHETISKSVRAVGLSTGTSNKGVWRFDEFGDDHFFVMVPAGAPYQSVWIHTTIHFFEFQLQVCKGAVLYLGNNFLHADPNRPGYEIVLTDTWSYIQKFPGPTILYNTTTPSLVDCFEFKRLWVSWADGDIRVGAGKLLSKSVLYFRDPNPTLVRAISMRTIDTGNGDSFWKFAKHSGKSTVLITSQEDTGFTKWLSFKEQTSFVFKIRADSDAHLALAEFYGVVTMSAYEIVLGDENNKKSSIKDKVGGAEKAGAEGPFLDGAQGRYFWVSWANDVIEIGMGPDIGHDIMMAWDASKYEGRHDVNAISVYTYKDDGYWEFSEFPHNVFEVITPMLPPTYDNVWLTVDKESFTFQLRACPEAHILLTEIPGEPQSNRYELVLGDVTHFTRTRDFDSIVELTEKNTTGLLDCLNYQEFWISWPNAKSNLEEIQFGTGSDVGENTIFSLDDELGAVPIHAISLATTERNEGYWVFDRSIGATTTFTTPDSYNREQVVVSMVGSNEILVKIKAEAHAHILLYEHYHTDLAYEIVIGGDANQLTGIRSSLNDDKYVASRLTPFILNGTRFTQFWVTWANSRVAVGKGVVMGQNEIVGYQDNSATKISVEFMAISTGWGSVGTWQFTNYFPDMLLVHSPPDSNSQTITYSFDRTQSSFTFYVRACEHVQIFLLPAKGQPPDYEILLATEGNTVTRLVRRGIEVHDQVTPDVLDCYSYRMFWLSWKDGVIALAMGGEGGRRVLEWEDPAPLAVHALSLATPEDVEADWQLFRISGRSVEFRMVSARSYRGMWYTLSGRHLLIFNVKTAKAVSMLFTEVPGISTIGGYEVHLANDLSSIKDASTGKTLTSNVTPFLLSEIESRTFWCTWDKGMLQVGTGAVPGGSRFLHANIDPEYEVNAATFGVKDEATWSFLQEYGNSYLVTTYEDLQFDLAWFAPKTNVFQFSVIAMQDARLALSQVPEVTTSGTYEVWFGAMDNTQLDVFYEGALVASAPGKGRLDPRMMKDYWIMWESPKLIVGESPFPDNVLLEYQAPKTFDVTAVALAADLASSAIWKVGQDQEIMTRLTTTSNGTYGTHWLTLVGFKSVVFRVRSCGPARLAVGALPDTVAVYTTEIVIGDGDRSYIRDAVSGRERDTAETPGILSCDDFRSFWISWSPSHLALGWGATKDRNTILHYRDDDLHDILAMAIATGPTTGGNANGTWEFFRMLGNVLYETSPAEPVYSGAVVVPQNADDFSLTFHVRTCADAHIMLEPIVAADITNYEIIFGSSANTLSEIRKSGKSVDSVSTPYLMTNAVNLPFWINWRGGNITAGLGALNDFPLLNFNDPEPVALLGARFGSWYGCEADWQVNMRIGDSIVLETPGVSRFHGSHISMLDTDRMLFLVMADHGAHIALGTLPQDPGVLAYEVVMQQSLTAMSHIRESIGGNDLAKAHTPDLLSFDTARPFWLKWNTTSIQLGTGHDPSDASTTKLTYSGPVRSFTSVSFASFALSAAVWEVKILNATDFGTSPVTPTPTAPSGPTTTPSEPTVTSTTPTTTEPSSTTVPTTTSSGPTTTSSTTTQRVVTDPSTTTIPAFTDSSPGDKTSTGPPRPTTPDMEIDEGGLSGGEIVGIVLGTMAGVLVLILLGLFAFIRLRPNPPQWGGEMQQLSGGQDFVNPMYTDPADQAQFDDITPPAEESDS